MCAKDTHSSMYAKSAAEAERLTEVAFGSLDANRTTGEITTGEMSRQAFQSRARFYRLFEALIQESPGGMRRRLLLERAAWYLGHSKDSITQIAFHANYGSLEAFTRAFRRAFRVSPSLYRRMGATYIHLPAPNGLHFHAPSSRRKGESIMDLFDRFAGSDSWHTRRILEQAKTLSEEHLDHPVNGTVPVFGWDEPDKSLREILERIVQTKEVWTAALTGGKMPKLDGAPPEDRTANALLARFEKADGEFNRFLTDVRNRDAWDDTFVDALCEPPESFTFGGTFAHVITFNTYRRLTALDALRRLGVNLDGFGCPMEFETSVAPWRPALAEETK